MCVCEGGTESGRERESAVCFPYIIKRNFVAKHGQELSILSCIYLFGQCRCGF